MARRRVRFTFPKESIQRPIIYELGQNFDVVTNIRRADVRQDMGWVILEIDGTEAEIDRGVDWIISLGVRVDPVEGDVLQG